MDCHERGESLIFSSFEFFSWSLISQMASRTTLHEGWEEGKNKDPLKMHTGVNCPTGFSKESRNQKD